jgi:ubiquinone/menaquinone biosynthesis C-methylase UbiE
MDSVSKLKNYWEKEYEAMDTPFDVENPDEWIAELEKKGKIRGNVLDSGCGPGRTSIYLAARGYDVTGVDISVNAIERARQKMTAKAYAARFVQANMCELSGYDDYFDTVIDIGCLHSLFEEKDRKDYAAALRRVCKHDAMVYLRAFSRMNLKRENYSADRGLPALDEEQIQMAFSEGWAMKDLAHREIDILGSHGEYKKGYCWFAEIGRIE